MRRFIAATCAFSFVALTSWGQQNPMCNPPSASMLLDVNNVSALIQNGGDQWWDLSGFAHYRVPKNTGRNTFFQQSIWFGGRDSGNTLHLAGVKYRQTGMDFYPGPLDENGEVTQSTCDGFDEIFPMTQTEVNEHVNGVATSTNVLAWPAKGNPYNGMPNQDLAPFVDVNNDEIYNALDGDYPLINGDQALWYVVNDKGNLHTETGGEQIGIEMQVMAYAYTGNGHENNATFYDYKIINKGKSLLDAYFGVMVDTDLGNPLDDFVACDTSRNLGFVFNGDSFDEDGGGILGYGAHPPMAGVRILESKLSSSNQNLKMSSFSVFDNGSGATGTPSLPVHYYQYMRGLWKDSSPFYRGGNGHASDPNSDPSAITKYMFSGSPADANSWSECSAGNVPGDRKMLLSAGEFDFNKGDFVQFTTVAIFAETADPYLACGQDFGEILEASDYLKAYHDTADQVFTSTNNQNFDFSSKVNIFPNPAKENFQVIGLEENSEFQLLNLEGKIMESGYLSSQQATVSVGHLPAGIYFLRVTNHQNVLMRKIIIQ